MGKVKKQALIFLCSFAGLMILTGLLFLPFIQNLQDPDYQAIFSERIAGLGIFGVVIFSFVRVLQSSAAVIPGGPIQVIAGAAFGTWGGLFILQLCCVISTAIAFSLVRKFGSSFVERIFGKELMEKWSIMSDKEGAVFITFILFLIPGVPKDSLTYLAALAGFSFVQFLPITLIARLPGMFSSTIMGDAAMQRDWTLFFVIFGITVIAGFLGVKFKEPILKRLARN